MTDIERPQDIISGSSVLVPPQALPQVISVRLDPALVAEIRIVAQGMDLTLSDVIRIALVHYLYATKNPD